MDSLVDKTVYEMLVTEVVRLGIQALHATAHSKITDAKAAVEAQMMILQEFPDIIVIPIEKTGAKTESTAEIEADLEYKELFKYLNGILERRKAQVQPPKPAKQEQPLTAKLDVDTTLIDAKLDHLSARVREIAQQMEHLESYAHKKEPPVLRQQDERSEAKPQSVSLTIDGEPVANLENPC